MGYYFDSGFTSHGFILPSGGTFTPLDFPGSPNNPVFGTAARAINPTGQITGYYFDANGYHGFLMIP